MIFRRVLVLAATLAAGMIGAVRGADIDKLQKDFQSPPDDARIMVRWWWFGPAVTREGIERDLRAMKAGGIGGVEVQPTYPLAVDGGTGDAAVKNLRFMSPEFLDMLSFTAAKCKELGLRMDLTMGSGWPYGGTMFTAAEGAGRLESQTVAIQPGQTSVAAPPGRGAARMVFAAFAGPAGAGRGADLSTLKQVPVKDGVAQLPAGLTAGEVLFFVSGRTGMQVKRPALGAEGNVIDHLNASVVDKFIKDIAEPEIKACGDNPPYAIFCDSLEVAGENWTDTLLPEFQKRRGYDLTPYLPALVGNIGERTDDVRHDYAQTITDMFNDNFNGKLRALAQRYHTRFRVQGYGSPPAGLYSYAFADLPEGEGGGNGNWRTFRTTRYAASASHLMGQKVTSSETFTWLHQAPFRATPMDIKGEVDTHFLDGINQVICHGWPYTPPDVAAPGWSFYAAGALNDKNPWYVAMPEISAYMQRTSQMLRQGTPATDIAMYLPDSDIWAKSGPGYSSMNAAFTQNSALLADLLDAGFNADGWDDGMLTMRGKADGGTLAFGDVKYKVVILPNVEHLPLETARTLKLFADGGGVLIATGRVPSKVPGLQATAPQQEELKAIMQGLFAGDAAKGTLVAGDREAAAAVAKKLPPDVALDKAGTLIGAVHRHTAGGEVYFLANTSNQKQSVNATFRVGNLHAEMWDPLSGKIRPLAAKGSTLALTFEPLESTIIVWTDRVLPVAEIKAKTVDFSTGWKVTFGTGGKEMAMDPLASWMDVEGMKNYSGVASYEKTFTASAQMLDPYGSTAILLGEVMPAAAGRGGNGYVANVTSPVRDAAVVYVNGVRAGAAWCAPLRVDIPPGVLKEGQNTVRIEVGNTAVNALAAQGFPNYDLPAIRRAFGNRFDPQNAQLLAQPLASGLLGPIELEVKK